VIDESSRTAMWGDVILKPLDKKLGNFYITEADRTNALGTTRGINFEALVEVPKQAMPWKIYKVDVLQKDQPRINQLRLEIFHPGKEGDPSQQRLVVGRVLNDKFVPSLTVSADCQVTIHGELTVDGEIVEGPIQADLDDPRFGSALLGGWLEGELAGATTLGAACSGALEIKLNAPDEIPPGGELKYEITIKNPGLGPVSQVMVFENLSYKGDPIRQQIISKDLIVNPGQELQPIEVKYQTPSDFSGKLIISLTAAGLRTGFIPVFANVSKEVKIVSRIE
jgi:hypothetical protein